MSDCLVRVCSRPAVTLGGLCGRHAGRRLPGFSTPEAVRLSGATIRQVDYWDRTGLVKPSIARAGGSGTRRLWSVEDVVCLRAIMALDRAGLALHGRADVVRAIRASNVAGSRSDATADRVLVVIDGERAVLASDGPGVEAALRGYSHAVAVWLPSLLEGLDEAA